MRAAVGTVVVLAAALALVAGCEREEAHSAAEGARPVTREPVGPIPGPGDVVPRVSPYRDDAVALMDGRRLFVQMNCAGCHGGHAGGGMGPSLRDVDWLYGSSDGDVYDSIAEGRAHGMPAWGTLLPSDVIWKLTSYVTSLRTPREPEPPE
jgi:cytochrome c oxidase cbb3-type subunit 3